MMGEENPSEDAPAKTTNEQGSGDTAVAVAGKELRQSDQAPKGSPKKQREKEPLIRPKQFGVLSAEEENLIKYSQEGDVEQVRTILRNKSVKVKVDCLDDSGTTPLEHASYKGNTELVELLLAAGADVNNNMQTQGYTPLMFAALAGKAEVVKILLRHGAKTGTTNAIGKTAAQLAGFVGQSQIAILISNFFTLDDLNYYTVAHGLEKEPKLPAAVAPQLHRFFMHSNLHPVKLIYFLRSNPIILEQSAAVLRTMEAIVEKEMKAKEMNEIMGMKIHYFSCVIKHVKKLQSEGKSIDDMIKLFVRGRTAKGFPEYLERFLRESIRSFPFYQTPLHTTMVHAIAKANLGGTGGSMSILEQSINGQSMLGRDGPPCETCHDPEGKRKCSRCKMVQYCNEECQKYHWPVHKKECEELAVQYELMEKRKVEQAEQERLEEEKRNTAATQVAHKKDESEMAENAGEGETDGGLKENAADGKDVINVGDVSVDLNKDLTQ